MGAPVSEPREELLRYLEQVSGRSLRTRAELDAYLQELKAKAQQAAPSRAERRWTIARHATLGVGLLLAALQYYLIDIYVQILSMQRLQFLNPEATPVQLLQRSAREVLRFLC
jgi:hypothetical protein